MTARTDLRFASGEDMCSAWHYTGVGDDLASVRGRPCVVMAHGFSATRDTGLPGIAQALAGAGADVLLFDYRHFGASEGEPRQLLSPRRQREDYAAAVAHARGLDGVDADRVVLWGTSFSGGHVFQLAAQDSRIAATIALTPAADGSAALLGILRREGPLFGGRLTLLGLRDAVRGLRGEPPLIAPAVGRPGDPAALTAPGAYEGMTDVAGPTWRNEVAARIFLQVGLYRPGRFAKSVRCPILVQIADEDQTVPPSSSMRAARAARAEVRHYPCDHFDVYPEREYGDAVIEHQIAFLRRRLGGGVAARDAAQTGTAS